MLGFPAGWQIAKRHASGEVSWRDQIFQTSDAAVGAVVGGVGVGSWERQGGEGGMGEWGSLGDVNATSSRFYLECDIIVRTWF